MVKACWTMKRSKEVCDSFTKEDLTCYAEVQSRGSKAPRGRPRTRPARSDGKYQASGVLLAASVFLSAQASPAPGLHEETMGCWGKRQRPYWQPRCGQDTERHAEKSVSREGLAQGPGARAQDTLPGSKQPDATSGAH